MPRTSLPPIGLPIVAYLEHIDDAVFLNDPRKADRYELAMNRLMIEADMPDKTLIPRRARAGRRAVSEAKWTLVGAEDEWVLKPRHLPCRIVRHVGGARPVE